MNKKLKDFIDEHRSEFDDDLPPVAAWHHIERTIGANQPAARFSWKMLSRWTAAAAAVLILSAGIYLLTKEKAGDAPLTPVVSQANGNDLGKIAPEFAAEANKIFKSIEEQQRQLRTLAADQPGLYSQFAGDLAALDSSYRVLKRQAVQTPGREVIIRAMIQNLQLQTELLSKQLMILREFNNNNKTTNNEKDTNRII